jgi:hypothetical protein
LNLKKQVLSILLICTFAFPTSLLAQETKTHEYYVASALKLPLLSFQSPAWHDITGSTFLGISTGLIAWAIAPSFITDPTHGHQWGDLHTLTDMELLQNERMVAEYLRVRHANPDNPVIRGFRGVNGMMDELDKILTFDPKTTSFSLKGILGEKITSFDIHKILNSLQFTNDYRAFTGDTVRFQNLLGTVRNIELSFSRQMAFMLDPSAFDEANFGRLTPIIARLKDTGSVSNGATFDHILKTDAHDLMRHTNRNLNGYFWINQESRFFDQHAQRMKQLKGPYKLKVALTGIVTGLVVGGLVYYTLTSTGPHYKGTDIIQNHNLNYDDVLAMMYSEDAQDREMYKVLVESSPEFAKQMSDLREGLVQQVRHRDHTIQQFNDYVAKKNKI